MTAVRTIETLCVELKKRAVSSLRSCLTKRKKKYFLESRYVPSDFFHFFLSPYNAKNSFGTSSPANLRLHFREIYFRGTLRDVYSPPFSQTFREGAVHLCRGTVVTRVPMRLSRSSPTGGPRISEELIAFVGCGLLKSNYSSRPYLRTVPAAAPVEEGRSRECI